MTKIMLTQSDSGYWTAARLNCWERMEVRAPDREQALLTLLAEIGVEVIQQGEHWVNGERREWHISNMEGR
jgi:hypothetical protein